MARAASAAATTDRTYRSPDTDLGPGYYVKKTPPQFSTINYNRYSSIGNSTINIWYCLTYGPWHKDIAGGVAV